MPGIFSKVSAYARSPEGQKLIKQARQAATDPKNRARAQQLLRQAQLAAKDPKNRAKVQELGDRLKQQLATRRPKP